MIARGTKADPVPCYDIHEGFDLCREIGKPIVVTLEHDPDKPHPDATLYKCYPSGRCLWTFDEQNPFQHFPDELQ